MEWLEEYVFTLKIQWGFNDLPLLLTHILNLGSRIESVLSV